MMFRLARESRTFKDLQRVRISIQLVAGRIAVWAMASLSGLVQRDLGDRRGVLDSHWVGALFVALVASMAGLAGAIRISVLKMDQRLMEVTASLAWA
jgi:hypothetical protein